MFTEEQIQIYFSTEDDVALIVKTANGFLDQAEKEEILNPLRWFQLFNNNKAVFDVIILGFFAARFHAQPATLVSGYNKGLDLMGYLKKINMDADIFKVDFINILKTMATMVTNDTIKQDIKKMKIKKIYDVMIILGPSGVGKSSMMKNLPRNFQQVRIVTTREARKNDGDEKIIVTEEEFNRMVENGDIMAFEEHSGNKYGVKKRDIEDIIEAKKIAVMDFKSQAYIKMKIKSRISVHGVSVTYEKMEDAEQNLMERQKEGSGETDDQIRGRLELIGLDEKFIEDNMENIEEHVKFKRTQRPNLFWKAVIKKVI